MFKNSLLYNVYAFVCESEGRNTLSSFNFSYTDYVYKNNMDMKCSFTVEPNSQLMGSVTEIPPSTTSTDYKITASTHESNNTYFTSYIATASQPIVEVDSSITPTEETEEKTIEINFGNQSVNVNEED
jgi:hypothetical protein